MESWVEKYRPNSLYDIQQQHSIISTLKASIKKGNCSHLLFYGPPGTGKTTTILAFAKELFGDKYKNYILELNASDDRGITVVRDKIKAFASRNINTNQIPFKIIILDEADSMTTEAQAALRCIIEKHSAITRFCLICNYVERIIAPIQSRCAKFKFEALSDKIMKKHLKKIIQLEDSTNNIDAKIYNFI